jgi:hypothetical protein
MKGRRPRWTHPLGLIIGAKDGWINRVFGISIYEATDTLFDMLLLGGSEQPKLLLDTQCLSRGNRYTNNVQQTDKVINLLFFSNLLALDARVLVDIQLGKVILGVVIHHSGHDGGEEDRAGEKEKEGIVARGRKDSENVKESDLEVAITALQIVEAPKPVATTCS